MPARIDALLDEMNERGATALHVVAGRPPHGRLRNELVLLRESPVSAEEIEEMCGALLSPAQRDRLASDRRLTVAIERSGLRYRASLVRFGGGLSAVLRAIPTRVPSLAELGCPEALWRVTDTRAGLLLVVGPPGSGKTTTATAMVDHLNKTRACHVATIEDPVEVVHEPLRAHLTQREVGAHVASREIGMRQVARDDADVVYVGELAPSEAAFACELAAGGALVLATMIASGVVDALEQLLAAAPSVRGTLAGTLVGVVGQRLLPGTGGGRSHVVAHEILLRSPTVSAAIRDGHTPQLVSVMQSGASAGMQTHDMSLERLLSAGRITPEIAMTSAADRDVVAKVVARLGAR